MPGLKTKGFGEHVAYLGIFIQQPFSVQVAID